MSESVAIIGGTGAEGSGLAARLAQAGVRIRIGSRTVEKASAAAEQIRKRGVPGEVTGHLNSEAAGLARIVILTVPLAAHTETLKSIRAHLQPGTILVDATVPLELAIGGRVSRVITLWDGSAAQQAARLAPPETRVVAAFHSLSADALGELRDEVDCDALICGDDREAKADVAKLAALIPGVRAIDAGPLENARYLENAAAMLIALNLQHKVKRSGIRITGLREAAEAGRRG